MPTHDQQSGFQPSGCITLTTDFGLTDPFVGLMKAVILSRLPNARLVDFTHAVPSYQPALAGFWLARCWQFAPAGTVHLAVVDPGVGTSRGVVAALLHGQAKVQGQPQGHLFISPDNGLLLELERKGSLVLRKIDAGLLKRVGLKKVSRTFHGRDLFAPLVAELAAGRIAFEELGPLQPGLSGSGLPLPVESEQGIEGEVIAIDHYGNAFTNIEAGQLQRLAQPVIEAGGHRLALRRTYGEAAVGEALAVINAFGVLELAVSHGHAARELALRTGTPVRVGPAVAFGH